MPRYGLPGLIGHVRLHDLYESWISSYTLSPLVIIPTDKLDYMTNLIDRHDILTTIEKYLEPSQRERRTQL